MMPMGAIHPVGLGQLAGGPREITHLARVDHHDRQAGGGELGGETGLQATRGLEADQRRAELDQAPEQGRRSTVVVGDSPAFAGRADAGVEPALGNVDADEGGGGGGLAHGPVLADAGSARAGPGDRSGLGEGLRGARLTRGLGLPGEERSPAGQRRQLSPTPPTTPDTREGGLLTTTRPLPPQAAFLLRPPARGRGSGAAGVGSGTGAAAAAGFRPSPICLAIAERRAA